MSVFLWSVTAITILLILIRPKQIPEAVWACSGALLLVIGRAIAPGEAIHAVGKGMDVYLFLTGMMMLAEMARREGFFDWVAVIAVTHAKASPGRLFAIVYAVGTVVTTFLSNDATAVVLTPAVLAALKTAKAKPLPYVLICAFIANAASFVLPISNPANLVLYGSKMPPLTQWLAAFALPSAASIVITYLVLRWTVRRELEGKVASDVEKKELSPAGKRAAYGIVGSGLALIAASAFNIDLGLPTCIAAVIALVFVTLVDREAPKHVLKDISWAVLPMVAGLFVIVEAINAHGALKFTQQAIADAGHSSPVLGGLGAAFGIALLSNIANNLPVGLIAGSAVKGASIAPLVRNALLIGVDLGPNLSITGDRKSVV